MNECVVDVPIRYYYGLVHSLRYEGVCELHLTVPFDDVGSHGGISIFSYYVVMLS